MQVELNKLLVDYNLPPISRAQEAKIDTYLQLLYSWNKIHNFTKIPESDAMLKHIVDSLHVSPHLGASVLDLGTGPGLPGIPLAIVRPDLDFTLVERIKKRCIFLDKVKYELALEHVEIKCCDLIEVAGKVDTIVCRAVAPLDELLKLCMPKIENKLIVMIKELNNPELLKDHTYELFPYSLRDQRNILVIQK